MLEAAMVFSKEGKVLHWHTPPDRSGGRIPDSESLWDFIWANRKDFGGIAHTHPWMGTPWPSHEDITTFLSFRSMERAQGRLFVWPIVTFDQITYWRWSEDHQAYITVEAKDLPFELEGVERLRELSR